MYVKQLFLITLLAFVVLRPVASVSLEQMEKMAMNLRKSCLKKIDTTEALVDGFRRGEFPDDYNLMCYTTCIMKLLRTFKNEKMDFDMMIKQVELSMPPENLPSVIDAINKCRHVEYTGDECQKTYQFVQCYYKQDPTYFAFP
ncbi:PREDICTED: general odorant-binding protein 99b [Eufriesea mexicana]|uniref:general odorant-binding protein 99b n=1 Tax=Eufriesea mexicana TaxID=516756 RepID=UPI00083BE5C1|nr:PREDICTED: general odorant-binding protein 99b [Eufriesea mexicana]